MTTIRYNNAAVARGDNQVQKRGSCAGRQSGTTTRQMRVATVGYNNAAVERGDNQVNVADACGDNQVQNAAVACGDNQIQQCGSCAWRQSGTITRQMRVAGVM